MDPFTIGTKFGIIHEQEVVVQIIDIVRARIQFESDITWEQPLLSVHQWEINSFVLSFLT